MTSFPLHREELAPELTSGDAKLARLFVARPIAIERRRTIIEANRDHGHVYRIKSGWCARSRYLRDGRAQIVALLLPGDLLGITGLLRNVQVDEVVALSNVEIEPVDRDVLRDEMARDWELSQRIMWNLVEDERRLDKWLIAAANGTAEEKLALLLVDLRGRLILANQVRDDSNEIPWHLKQSQIADAVGLTPVHVNRTLKKMRAEGLVSFSRSSAHLRISRLHEIARPLLDVYELSSSAFGAVIPAASK